MRNRIKYPRGDNDLKQYQAAQAIGITARKYSYIENGIQQPNEEILIAIAKFYETSADYLLGLTGEKEPYPGTSKRKL